MILILDLKIELTNKIMVFMEYASFWDSSKHVMASARHFGRIMRCQDSYEK
jgi:hypothetical protein